MNGERSMNRPLIKGWGTDYFRGPKWKSYPAPINVLNSDPSVLPVASPPRLTRFESVVKAGRLNYCDHPVQEP